MLHRILLIAKRDYIGTVLTKTFLMGLLVAPLLLGGSFLGLGVLKMLQKNEARHVAIMDNTEANVAANIIAAAESKRPSAEIDNPLLSAYKFTTVPAKDQNSAEQQLGLSDRVRGGELFGFLEIDKLGKTTLYTNSGSNVPTQMLLVEFLNTGMHRARLAKLGIDQQQAKELLRPVTLETRGLASKNPTTGQIEVGKKRNPLENLAVPLALVVLMMIIVLMGSAPMLTAVAEDKTQRVFEMMLASTTSFEIIMGKVIASVGCSLTGSVVYITSAIFTLQSMAMIGMAPFELLPWFFIYLICEVTMLSAFGAALGSACSNPRDAQQLNIVIMLPVLIPMMFFITIMEQPNGMFATAMSLFPPFTPILMMMRQAMPGGVPAWQPWVALAGMLIWTLITAWIASRIFRVGLLMQGKPPKIADLARWAVRG